jgi:hypothetical protein
VNENDIIKVDKEKEEERFCHSDGNCITKGEGDDEWYEWYKW